jgi:hypothetical protein
MTGLECIARRLSQKDWDFPLGPLQSYELNLSLRINLVDAIDVRMSIFLKHLGVN